MNSYKRKSLKTNAGLNILKQFCTILFQMITFPYVSRTLGAEAYGKLSFSSSIIGYVSLIAGLGIYNYAVRNGSRIRDNKKEFSKFACEVFSINILSMVVAYIFMIFVIYYFKSINLYKNIVLVLSISIFFSTIGTDWINAVYEEYVFITARYIVCQLLSVFLIIFFIKSPNDLILYAFFSIFGTIIANIFNIYYIKKVMKINIKFTLKFNIKKHLKPILIIFGNAISSMIYVYADNFMLGILIGDIAVAYYTVASKIYMILKQLLNSIANVAIPRFSHDVINQDSEKININFNRILGFLILLLLPMVAGLISIGEQLIIVISGYEYEAAYSALVILSLSLICSTIACIYINVVMMALCMERKILLSTTISAFCNIILNLFLIPKYSYNAAAFTTLISEIIMTIFGLYFTRRYINLKIYKEFISSLIGMFWVFFACYITKHFFYGGITQLLISITVSVFGYGIILIFLFKEKASILKQKCKL